MAKIALPESQNVECKEIWRDDYLKWVCGFANASGGYIYIGVVDGSHEIVGVDNSRFNAGFIDTWGRGYKKIYTGFKNNGLPIPTVANHFSGVQVVIKRTVFQNINQNVVDNVVDSVGDSVGDTTVKKENKKFNLICQLAKENPFITATELSDKLSVSHRTTQRYLAKMQEAGIIIREGNDNGGRWIVLK